MVLERLAVYRSSAACDMCRKLACRPNFAAVPEPRPSASVILVRDGQSGLESFMVRRHAQSAAFASAYVFPGGTVRADDLEYPVSDDDRPGLAAALNSRSDAPVSTDEACAFYVCAVRELFEEAGVLLARDFTIGPSNIALQERLESTRLTLQAGQMTLREVLVGQALAPAFECLVPFSHWITPRAVARRFDTRFFIAEMPADQSALHDTIETSEGIWLTPARALEPDYHTVFATAQHLRRLCAFADVASLVDFARGKSIRTVTPELMEHREGIRVVVNPDIAETW